MEHSKYDVFISYSRKDYVDERKNVIPGNHVSKIRDALTQAGITYWFDEEGIYSGQNFVEKIVTNIENAKIFLFLSTVNSNQSPWTCKEIASADEFKKNIIPVRIDSSPYNKKVLFRIADLDYIDYYVNPQKGIKDMVKSIKANLDELAAEERRKAEELIRKEEEERKKAEEIKRKNEVEEKRRQEEQQKLISEIRLSCTTLNNEEAKLELSRENLLIKTKMVSDESQRAELVLLIQDSNPIENKTKEKITDFLNAIEDHQERIRILTSEKENALVELNEKKGEIKELLIKEHTLQTEIDRLKTKEHTLQTEIDKLKTKKLMKANNTTPIEAESKNTSLISLEKSNKRLKVGISILAPFTVFLLIGYFVRHEKSTEIAVLDTSINPLQGTTEAEQQIQEQETNNTLTVVTDETILQAVDLGLSVKWANMNVGAKSSFQIGDYFAWGEVSAKETYNKATYMYYSNKKYNLIGEIGKVGEEQFYNIGGTEYDAATKIQGKEWRLPTESECLELMNNCTWVWDPSKNGYIVTGKNGNSIFFPATGCMSNNHVAFLSSKAKKGFYWSSKTAKSTHYSKGESASAIQFDPYSTQKIVVSPIDRVIGRCIRAVCE